MNYEKKDVLFVSLIVLIIITQGFTIYSFISSDKVIKTSLDDGLNKLSNDISLNKKETQSNINVLTDEISKISSAQDSFSKELSEVKASASSDFSGIIEQEIKGVVTIRTDVSQGTGFIITREGYVVTNYHVIEGAKAANVITYDNKIHAVGLIGYDPSMDVALLKIEGTFNNVDLGDSSQVKIGEKVIAIGNPLGLSFTATEGIISAKNRVGDNDLPYYLQTDVGLNPGNSGGPLINTKGEVIGINNFKVSDAENLGFALEINYAIDTINTIALDSLNETIV